MGVYTLVFTGTSPIGNFLTGIITQNMGANISFLISGALTAVIIILIYMYNRSADLPL